MLGHFRALRARHLPTQAQTLDWLAHAHARAEAQLAAFEGRPFDEHSFFERMKHRLARFGCDSSQIATRGHELEDCSHLDWDRMLVYRLNEAASGAGMSARTKVFGSIAGHALQKLFVEVDAAPRHLIHVTCTGYEAPSAAQLLVAAKNWGQRTSVTHAYHMGCYAALPAVRIATGLAAQPGGQPARGGDDARVDVVHTELCSLHLNPLRHDPEQLVIQSLFADGCIAYSVWDEAPPPRRDSLLAVLSQVEWIVPDSAESMAWFCSDFGMEMTLARDVPAKIGEALVPFVERLLAEAGERSDASERAVFAIHPGGPKIVDQVATTLRLADVQVAFSRAVLLERGNMSSATLPHVWQAIAKSPSVYDGQLVISLAFGPGLTLSGAVLRKVSAC